MVSLIAVVDGGPGIEVGIIGREGVVGMTVALGGKKSPIRALVQGEGTALRMKAEHFTAALAGAPAMRREFDRITFVAMSTAMQIAVCNKAHRLEARFARWLLMVRDRLSSETFYLTQDFLARMLGVRRAGVNETAGVLQNRSLIRYTRGRIVILDAKGLTAAACSCYAVIRNLENRSR